MDYAGLLRGDRPPVGEQEGPHERVAREHFVEPSGLPHGTGVLERLVRHDCVVPEGAHHGVGRGEAVGLRRPPQLGLRPHSRGVGSHRAQQKIPVPKGEEGALATPVEEAEQNFRDLAGLRVVGLRRCAE